jgi:ribosomal protein L11 methylase PrmA
VRRVRDPDWWRIGLVAPEHDEEAVTEALADAGLEVQEVIVAPPEASTTDGSLPEAGEVWLRAYVATESRDVALEAVRAVVQAWGPSLRALAPAPLERAAWASWFEPVVVGAVRLAQAPETNPAPDGHPASEGEHVVWLRPGMGFGAGEHPHHPLHAGGLAAAHAGRRTCARRGLRDGRAGPGHAAPGRRSRGGARRRARRAPRGP